MKIAVFFLTLVALLINTSPSYAFHSNDVEINSNTGGNSGDNIKSGNIESNVNIKNEGNLDSESSVKSETSVNIEHDGGGNTSSEVTINGKTYKLEGPGSIKVENDEVSTSGDAEVEDNTGSQPPNSTDTEDVLGESAILNDIEEEKTGFIDAVITIVISFFKRTFNF